MTLQLWDTHVEAGKIEITGQAAKESCSGVILAYDTTDRQSYNDVSKWFAAVEQHCGRANLVKLLVATKKDMEDKRQVALVEGRDLATQFKVPFIETSAKSGENAEEMTATIGKELLKVMEQERTSRARKSLKRERSAGSQPRKSSGLSKTNERAYEHSSSFQQMNQEVNATKLQKYRNDSKRLVNP